MTVLGDLFYSIFVVIFTVYLSYNFGDLNSFIIEIILYVCMNMIIMILGDFIIFLGYWIDLIDIGVLVIVLNWYIIWFIGILIMLVSLLLSEIIK